MKRLLPYLCFGLLGLQNLQAQDALPSMQIKDMDGNVVNVKDLADSSHLTIISFWATWCGPCIKELDQIQQVYAEWQEKYKAQLIAVTVDDSRNTRKVKPMVIGRGWNYKVLMDENQDLARALNVNNPPMTFLINKKGQIVYSHQGYVPGAEDELEKKLQEAAAQP
ncbi:MAG: TlpA family protein disulfide reductase [Bacteroidetes bacterium]|nr:TlpA family protein disulfide reductase [Bacteroidota bacterium]